jgi:hypothetical protein
MRLGGWIFVELLHAFRVTLVVFVAVVAVAYVHRDLVAASLASMDAFQNSTGAGSLPARFWLIIALRLGFFAAAVPLSAEGWLLVCRLRSAPTQMRLWPAFCVATMLALAGALALTSHFAGELRRSLVYFSDARAPNARPAHWNAAGGVVRPSPSPS